jgi:DNA-3-methyladenine glycosylase II
MDDLQSALKHYKKVDTVLHAAALKVRSRLSRLPEIRQNDRLFSTLCESVVSQQLSVKAADTIFARLKTACGGKVTPAVILKLKLPRMRSCGLSAAKCKTLKELAKALTKGLSLTSLRKLSAEEATKTLTAIWGIGPWTAEMFLLFGLGHPDIFAPGDLGLVRSIETLYGKKNPTRPELLELSAPWSPYRSLACRILWKHRDTKIT